MSKPFDEWFPGPWRIIEETSLNGRPRLAPGEVMHHRSGAVLLNCPACNAMQIGKGVEGAADAPTLTAPVHCGKGFCHRCGIWFTVTGGATREAVKPTAKPVIIAPELRKAGVRPAPSLEAALRRVTEQQGD